MFHTDKLNQILISVGLIACWAVTAAVSSGLVEGLPDGFVYFLAGFALLATLGVSMLSGPYHRLALAMSLTGFALFVPIGLMGIFGILRAIYRSGYEEYNSHSH